MAASVGDLLTADELAERLKVRPHTIRQWRQQGRIPARKLSHKVVRYSLVDVMAALDASQCPRGKAAPQ